MQDPASTTSRRRSWSRHTSKATCGLIKPSSPESNTMTDPTSTTSIQQDPTTPRSMASTQRRKSIRERFFTVGAANNHVEKDREMKKLDRPAYVPTHAASSFERTTSPRPPTHEGENHTGPDSGDCAAFVSQSEARDVARELYGEHPVEERPVRRRPSNKVARRIVEYVKPPKEER